MVSTTAADAHPDILSVVYDEQQLAESVSELGRRLAKDYEAKQPLLLGALTGAFVFMADLARAMAPVPAGMTVDFFAASSYGAATVASGDVSVNMAAAKIDVAGRHVLVVEDIIDTGATLKRVVARLQEAGAASVKVAVLLDKAARRKVDIQPDYCALLCPDEFVVGYGLDFNEAYRSLPYVGVLKPELYMNT
jgi:hypoxanthine phosphoribosyltransferase